MAVLMGKDPEAGAEETLEEGIDAPEDDTQRLRRDVPGSHELLPDIEGRGEVDHVTEDIAHAADDRALVAVLGNGIADVLDGEVGHLELIPVCVDQLAILLLARGVVGSQRGQRRGRGRIMGRVAGRHDGTRVGVGGGRGNVPPQEWAIGSRQARGGRGSHVA